MDILSPTCDLNILWSLLLAQERRGLFMSKKCLLVMCQDVSGAFIHILT